ncbi:hypothetical protein KHA94_21715 [Bacillus sp. FJAT-49705]|uniref:Uncharacterized protein n=1 Tax=Cytobacillus citreus TaxID=2833586 RepID=A0ABS5NY34_9BACI|nr:DUF5412 family protein [Cytobacillus citreus]MBS4192752.1 hypothetical protein [Cytobacillus citreus]
MEIKNNLWSFYLIWICIGVSVYSLFSNINNTWLIAPPNYILLLVSVIAFILGIKGFKDKRNWWTKLRSWLTVILSLLLSIILLLAVLLTLLGSYFGANSHLETISSPDGKYTIDFYRWDAGAAGSFGIRGELNGPFWFKKRIYYEKRTENVEIEWENNNTVSINNHIFNLDEGDTYGYQY